MDPMSPETFDWRTVLPVSTSVIPGYEKDEDYDDMTYADVLDDVDSILEGMDNSSPMYLYKNADRVYELLSTAQDAILALLNVVPTYMGSKTLDVVDSASVTKNVSDVKLYGDPDTFALLCKASSAQQGWMKSTKVCNVDNGCIIQVTTQQRNPDCSYAVAEALTYVPGVHIDTTVEPRRLVPIDSKLDSEVMRQLVCHTTHAEVSD